MNIKDVKTGMILSEPIINEVNDSILYFKVVETKYVRGSKTCVLILMLKYDNLDNHLTQFKEHKTGYTQSQIGDFNPCDKHILMQQIFRCVKSYYME